MAAWRPAPLAPAPCLPAWPPTSHGSRLHQVRFRPDTMLLFQLLVPIQMHILILLFLLLVMSSRKYASGYQKRQKKQKENLILKSSCDNLEAILKRDGKSDIDATELYGELRILRDFFPREDMGAIEILKFLKRHDCFPNATIAYRLMLTIPVTVASAERSFSKLKLLKSYLRSTMTQERLNDLAMIALEGDLLEKIDYERIIEEFISKNTQRMTFFK